jgi:hypothetical protein
MCDVGLLTPSLRDVRAAIIFPRLDLRAMHRLSRVCQLLARELRPVLGLAFAKEVSGTYASTDASAFRAPLKLVSLRLDLTAAGDGKMLFCYTTPTSNGEGHAAGSRTEKRIGTVCRETPTTFAVHFTLEVIDDPGEELAVKSVDETALFMVEPARRVCLPGLPVRLSQVTMTLESARWGTFNLDKRASQTGESFADAVLAKERAGTRMELSTEPRSLAASY